MGLSSENNSGPIHWVWGILGLTTVGGPLVLNGSYFCFSVSSEAWYLPLFGQALLPHHDNEPAGWWSGILLKSRGEVRWRKVLGEENVGGLGGGYQKWVLKQCQCCDFPHSLTPTPTPGSPPHTLLPLITLLSFMWWSSNLVLKNTRTLWTMTNWDTPIQSKWIMP